MANKGKRVTEEELEDLLTQVINGFSAIIRVTARPALVARAVKELPNYPGDYEVVHVKDSIRSALVAFVQSPDKSEVWEETVDTDQFADRPLGWAKLLQQMQNKSYGRTFFVFVPKALAHKDFLEALEDADTGPYIVVVEQD